MKKTTLLLFMISFFCLHLIAQTEENSQNHLFAGLSFNYLNLDLELQSYSTQNWIDGESFGWTDWTSEEIDELNEFIDIKQYWLSSGLMFGAWLYKPQEKPLSIKIIGQIGYPVFKHSEKQVSNGELAFEGEQKGTAVFGGLSLVFQYQFKKWGLMLRPSFNYLNLSSDKVSYNYLAEGSYTTEYDFETTGMFPSIDLMATYQVSKIELYVGPAYYQYFNDTELTIQKKSSLQIFQDDIQQEFQSIHQFGGVVGYNWELFDRFLWSSHIRLGADLGFETSLLYQF